MGERPRTRKEIAALADGVLADPVLSKLPSRELARRFGCSEWTFRKRRNAAAGKTPYPRSDRGCPCCGGSGRVDVDPDEVRRAAASLLLKGSLAAGRVALLVGVPEGSLLALLASSAWFTIEGGRRVYLTPAGRNAVTDR